MAMTWPTPAGPNVVGTRTLEYVDTRYASPYPADAGGRRMALHAWYPAAAPTRRRRYFEGAERAEVGARLDELLAQTGFTLGPACFDDLAERETFSHIDAPVASTGPYPCLVFSHGAMFYPTQSSLLCEHLASHGYVVLSVAHSGGATIGRAADGHDYPLDQNFVDTVWLGKRDRAAAMARIAGEVGDRHAAMQALISTSGDGWALHTGRWADDIRAVVDRVCGDPPDDPADGAELFAAVDRERIAAGGFSMGGDGSTLAAQRDERIRAAINLDGAEWTGDLFGVQIRVPLLMICADFAALSTYYGLARSAFFNEFFYEDAASLGERRDITRVSLSDTSHLELTDFSLVEPPLRGGLRGGGVCTYETAVEPVNDLVLGFLDQYLSGAASPWLDAAMTHHPTIQLVSVAGARKWARDRSTSATPTAHGAAP